MEDCVSQFSPLCCSNCHTPFTALCFYIWNWTPLLRLRYIRKAKQSKCFPCVDKLLLFISLIEYTITMYDTKSRELRWNATYSDYASTLPDDDTKYSETLRPFSRYICPTDQTTKPDTLTLSPQRWLTLCPMATALSWPWTVNLGMCSGSRITTRLWLLCISGSVKAYERFPTPTWQWKPCVTWPLCLERSAASLSGNTRFPKRRSHRTSSCKQIKINKYKSV